MRIWVGLALTLVFAACKKPVPDWKQRTGPDFTVEAPFAAHETHVPVPGNPTDMTVYLYVNEVDWSLQVQVVEMPKDRIPMDVITAMRDRAAAKGTVTKEADVAMGDAPGKDLWMTTEIPPYGKVEIRERMLMQAHKVYQVMAVHLPGVTVHDKDDDRFIESFKLTGQPLDMQTAYHDAVGSDAPPLDIRKVGAGTPDPDGWYTAHSAAGRFTVRLPGPYNEVHTDVGAEGVVNAVSAVRMPERIKLSATCVDGGKPAKLDDFAKMDGVTAHRERDVHGHRAIEVTAGNAMSMMVERQGGACVLTVEPYSKTAPVPEADAHTMFDSFTLD